MGGLECIAPCHKLEPTLDLDRAFFIDNSWILVCLLVTNFRFAVSLPVSIPVLSELSQARGREFVARGDKLGKKGSDNVTSSGTPAPSVARLLPLARSEAQIRVVHEADRPLQGGLSPRMAPEKYCASSDRSQAETRIHSISLSVFVANRRKSKCTSRNIRWSLSYTRTCAFGRGLRCSGRHQ